MSSRRGEFRSSPNLIPSVSSTDVLPNNSGTNDISGAGGENGSRGLVVIKQEQSSLQDYTKSLNTNYSNNSAEGCNMLQKVPSLSDLSDPENSLGTCLSELLF